QNLPTPRQFRLLVPSSLLPSSNLPTSHSKRLQCSMGLPPSHVPLLRGAFQVQLLPRKRMGRCAALPIIRSIHRSADQSEMALFVSCMPLALAIAAPVRSVRNVTTAVPARNPDGSVP